MFSLCSPSWWVNIITTVFYFYQRNPSTSTLNNRRVNVDPGSRPTEFLPGLWKCCIALLVPETSVVGVFGALGVCGADGVCELCVLLLVWMVEQGEDPPGDRFSSQSLERF